MRASTGSREWSAYAVVIAAPWRPSECDTYVLYSFCYFHRTRAQLLRGRSDQHPNVTPREQALPPPDRTPPPPPVPDGSSVRLCLEEVRMDCVHIDQTWTGRGQWACTHSGCDLRRMSRSARTGVGVGKGPVRTRTEEHRRRGGRTK